LLRAIKGQRFQACPGSDLTALLFHRIIAPDDKVVLIGGSAQQARELAQRRGLRALRHYDPPMGFVREPLAVEQCLQFIESESPFRFCLLAVGCPQQELLAHALKQRARARGLALCIGASINFLTGVEQRAPAWMTRLGMEWLHRLLQHPARLAGRYLVRGPRIFLLLPRITFKLRRPIAAPT
jgi:exopolysaccharide biosynthesis WecB/TagA/CpsF family protein